MPKSLFARKPISLILEEMAGENRLRRVLGPVALTSLGIGAIIGTGIFVLTGVAAHDRTGPALMLSFVFAGITCIFAALCYAEFASMIPVAGSAYTYSYATLGELFAWIIGWDLILEYALGASTIAVGWAGNLISILQDMGIQFPAALAGPPGSLVALADGSTVTGVFNLPAAVIVLLVSAILVIGIRESAGFNTVIVVVKVAVLLLFIAFGIKYINTANWHPFIPPNTGKFGEFGWSGVLRGAGVIFFAFIGFDAVSTSAQEAKNPQRDLPRGILWALIICTLLYVLVSGVMVGLVPYKAMLNQPAPLVIAVQAAAERAAGTPWSGPMAVVKVL